MGVKYWLKNLTRRGCRLDKSAPGQVIEMGVLQISTEFQSSVKYD